MRGGHGEWYGRAAAPTTTTDQELGLDFGRFSEASSEEEEEEEPGSEGE